jgi:hypothetical protein
MTNEDALLKARQCDHRDLVLDADGHRQAWEQLPRCPEPASVEVKAADPEDPSGGFFCREHAFTFLGAEPAEATAGILQPAPLETSVTVHHKLGLPDYSSVEASMRVMGITRETTDEDIEEMAAKAKIAWAVMGPAVTRQVKAAREKNGW